MNELIDIAANQYDQLHFVADKQSKVYRYKLIPNRDFTSQQLYTKYFNTIDINKNCFLGGVTGTDMIAPYRGMLIDWRHLHELIIENRQHYIDVITSIYGLNINSDTVIKKELKKCYELSLKLRKNPFEYLNTAHIYMRNIDNLPDKDKKQKLFNFLVFKYEKYWNSLYALDAF